MKNEIYVPTYPVRKSDFAFRLRTLRIARKYAIGDLADRLGVHRKTYSTWEKSDSKAYPSDYNQLIALCELLDTTPYYLLCGLFGESKDKKISDVYLNIYDRFIKDEEFHYFITLLMRAEKPVLKAMNNLVIELNRMSR